MDLNCFTLVIFKLLYMVHGVSRVNLSQRLMELGFERLTEWLFFDVLHQDVRKKGEP
jgi:hypothetical protein